VAVAGDGVTINDHTRIFAGVNNDQKLTGDIGELIVYDAALSSDDIAIVEAYLKAKWNTP
jgi:hypothetical protein